MKHLGIVVEEGKFDEYRARVSQLGFPQNKGCIDCMSVYIYNGGDIKDVKPPTQFQKRGPDTFPVCDKHAALWKGE